MPDVLESSKFFNGCSPEELQLLQQAVQMRQFAAGLQVFAEGDEGDGLYVIESGRVQITALVGQDQRRRLSQLGPGDVFGEMAVLDSAPRSATAIAEEDTRAGFIPRDDVLRVLQKSPHFAASMMREFSQRMRDFNRRYVREVIEAERLALVGRFARSIVHDFKNPLNVISLAAELVARDNVTPPMRQTAKTRICKQVERLSNMISELLDFTRGSQSTAVLAPTNYADFVRQLIEEVEPELRDKRVAISCEDAVPNLKLLLDPPRLMRVFFNLINNAVDVMPDGGSIRLRFQSTPGEVVTEIEDSGPGIAPEIAPRMFQPFATHGKSHGTGLGLSICRRIVEDHKGRINVKSEPRRGAIFCFSLPVPEQQPTA